MPFDALPGVFDVRQDGDLAVTPINQNPIICIIGTAVSGSSERLTIVNRITDAARSFGRDGTLVRGLFEVAAAGGLNIRLYRIGASAATLASVGTGITITTVGADESIGRQYTLFWDDTADRLRVYRESDGELVYDNNPTYPSLVVDLGEVSVTGTASGSPGNIGTLAAPITMEAAHGVSGAVYTRGTDGVLVNGVSDGLSRMELFEALYNAYEALENEDLDLVIPMGVFMDDLNVSDLTTAQITTRGLAALTTYPIAGEDDDVLGRIFVQDYQGRNYFWWDTDRDGIAEIFPTVGSSTATTDADGNALAAADFHEANFAYQLADFCYRMSSDNEEMMGHIGVRPPASFSSTDISAWVGYLPTHAVDSSGNDVISVNGTGLLGNKWVAGRLGNSGTGLLSHTVDGVAGLWRGGFIATDDGWPDGTQQDDRNGRVIDIGKYISLIAAQPTLANPFQTNSYIASGAGTYCGFDASLPGNVAATNKPLRGVRLPFRVKNSKVDALARRGYVMFHTKPKGVVVSDAPTAAREGSDWRRQSTMKIVKATLDAVRVVADPFLGETLVGAKMAALDTSIDRALGKLQKAEFLQRFEKSLTATPSQQVQGQATLELKLVPAFELRQLTVNVALAAS